MNRVHRQWNSRGYLPHCDQPCKMQSVTIRLSDSMPAKLRKNWEVMIKRDAGPGPRAFRPPGAGGTPVVPGGGGAGGTPVVPEEMPGREDARKRARIEAWLDAGYGSCALRDPAVAAMVEGALLFGDGSRYRLLAWVIMPNHVHFLFEMVDGWPLGEVLHGLKSFTSHEANRILHRSGEFWYRDYRDRYVRDREHLREVTRYIHENPVKAGLVAHAEDWPWSSARFPPRETTRKVDCEGNF